MILLRKRERQAIEEKARQEEKAIQLHYEAMVQDKKVENWTNMLLKRSESMNKERTQHPAAQTHTEGEGLSRVGTADPNEIRFALQDTQKEEWTTADQRAAGQFGGPPQQAHGMPNPYHFPANAANNPFAYGTLGSSTASPYGTHDSSYGSFAADMTRAPQPLTMNTSGAQYPPQQYAPQQQQNPPQQYPPQQYPPQQQYPAQYQQAPAGWQQPGAPNMLQGAGYTRLQK